MVVDILFCCPRETMGGWSSDLIAINEAIFDDHLIVWKYDWGIGLLKSCRMMRRDFQQAKMKA